MTASLDQLEREVEHARARLATDLSRLRDPKTMTDAKDDLLTQARDYKGEMMDRARITATDTAHSFLDDVRLRVERNPTAAIVIGAGIAYHLLRHPPIASLLVAAGVASLVNTSNSGGGSRTPTTDALRSARDMAYDQAARVSSTVQDTSRQLADQAQRLGSQVREAAAGAGSQVAAATSQAASQVAGAADLTISHAAVATTQAMEYASDATDEAREQIRENPIYFGAAALAVGAALGLAMSRNLTSA